MATYPFLSDEWVAEARRIREEAGASGAAIAHSLRMNLVITEVPFGEGSIDAHLDSTDGLVEVELGHVGQADLEVRLDYPTAKAILVERDAQTWIQAFMSGRIQIEGDLAKLVALQGIPPGAETLEMRERLRRMTA